MKTHKTVQTNFRFCPECGSNDMRNIFTSWPEYGKTVICNSCKSEYRWTETGIYKQEKI